MTTTILTTVLLTILAITLIPLAVCWFSTMIVTSRCKTPAEAGVRGLYYLARWLHAVAEGANAFVIGYHEVMAEVDVDPSCECVRRLAEEKVKKMEAEKVRKHVRRGKKAENSLAGASASASVTKAGLGTRMLKFVFG